MKGLYPVNTHHGSGSLTMSLANGLTHPETHGFETFHTPSFGDEDFDIPPLTLAGVTHPLGSYTTQPLSHPHATSIATSNLSYTQPLSHHPVANNPHPGHQVLGDLIPKFPPQNIDIPDINVSSSILVSTGGHNTDFKFINPSQTFHVPQTLHSKMASHPSMTTISQSQLSSELGMGNSPQSQGSRSTGSGSPPGSNTTSPGRESSEESSDDSVPLAQLAVKRTATEPVEPTQPTAGKKPKTPKKRKKKDPNEPQKPVSAYALFFRDTQAAIKGQNPNASFGEVSKIVASMWDGLDAEHKAAYKKKTEVAKKEYLKQLAAYRASLVSKQTVGGEQMDPYNKSSPPPAMMSQKPLMPNTMPNTVVTMHNPTSSAPPLTHMPVTTSAPMHHTMMSQSVMGMGQQLPPLAPRLPMPQHSPQPQMMHHMPTQAVGYGMTNHHQMGPHNPGYCIRNGCQNPAIEHPGWDNEYCSNECVVSHCRDVFTAWIASRQTSNSYASVK